MATKYQSTIVTDSMDDNFEEKTHSEQSDEDSPLILNQKNNSFMHQVRRSRKNSFSYNNNEPSDSPNPIVEDIDNTFIHDTIDEYKSDQPPIKPSFITTQSEIIFLKRQNSYKLIEKPTKLIRRHSADKILCKASYKNINSRDYLNRMVIALRHKIGTYREDLRIAGELGQNLFSQNGKKDLIIQQYEQDIHKLKAENDEMSTVKSRLLQTTKIGAEHTQRLETDLHHEKTFHIQSKSKYQEKCELLQEQLEHNLSDIRHLQQLSERQRLEIQTLDTRNEQISQNAGETIDDLSRELAEEKDGHSNLKYKYQKIHNEFTKLKINYEKRGTGINNLKKKIQENELKMLSLGGNNMNGSDDVSPVSKQQIRLLYRQIDNYKDEIEGMQKHVDATKSYLKTTMSYLENTGLLMKTPDIAQIYTLCKNARQFLGIHKPPPDPVYQESPEPPPALPKERSLEPLPSDDDTHIPPPSIPREPTPELKVSPLQHIPIPVPTYTPKTPSPPPPIPPPLQPPPPTPLSPSLPPLKAKISNTPSLPPSLPPSQPHKPSLPLPPPPTHTHTHITPKLHHLPTIPDSIHITPSLPAPTIPTTVTNIAPSLPTEEIHKHTPKSNIIHTAMVPKQIICIVPPKIPTNIPHIPSPNQPLNFKLKISSQAMAPPTIPPPMPRECSDSVPMPMQRQDMPKVRTHNLGVMPATATALIVDEKLPLSIPCVPRQRDKYKMPLLPQDLNGKGKQSRVVNMAMAPPSLPPPMPGKVEWSVPVPAPRVEKKKKMESVRAKVQSNNVGKPKKKKTVKKQKKKSKKPKKERDSMEEQKVHLSVFFSTYSDNKNWAEGGKENGVQKYILKFAEREPLNARMAFLYSMTLYLGQIVGVNKRCITHAFMLFKSVRAQIDTLCEEFALILQTLEHHNDDKLWKYVYSFLYNAAAYFKHIQRFVGTRTSVDNPRKYSRSLKDGSRDFSYSTRNARRESSFRKLSGLSEVNGPFVGHYNNNNDHRIYGSVGNKKKKKSSYA